MLNRHVLHSRTTDLVKEIAWIKEIVSCKTFVNDNDVAWSHCFILVNSEGQTFYSHYRWSLECTLILIGSLYLIRSWLVSS